METIREDYFNWLTSLASNLCSDFGEYNLLFEYLYFRIFISDIGNDMDRASDGKELRHRFAENSNYTYRDVYLYLDDPCNMLELIVALAFRCDDFVLAEPDDERTGYWIYSMLHSLQLDGLTDDRFDEDYASEAIDIFLNHEYRYNGEGGLFVVNYPPADMRTAEIWCQMNWFLDEFAPF